MKHALITLLAASLVSGCGTGPSPREQAASDPAPPVRHNAAPAPPATSGSERILEAESLLGEPLYRPEFSPEQRARLERDLTDARAALESHPDSEEAIIWVGRRLAYLGRYNEALDTFTAGLERHPESYRLLRHRGHRYLTLRRIDDAIDDLAKAARLVVRYPDQMEPDGAPNAAGVARSTDRFNIYYHLGLGFYLRGETARAVSHFNAALQTPLINDDLRVAANYWIINTYATASDAQQAWIENLLKRTPDPAELFENHAYADLILLHRGRLTPEEVMAKAEANPQEFATRAYGVAVWMRTQDLREEEQMLLEEIVKRGSWPAFGYLAAEVELTRRAHRDAYRPTR